MNTETLWLLIAAPCILLMVAALAVAGFCTALVLLDRLFITPAATVLDTLRRELSR
jgi:hypothetical protein